MDNLSTKITTARQEGYSDTEILQHLSGTELGPKIDAARKEGYSDTDIADHLGGTKKPQEVSGIVDQIKAGFDAPTENMGISMEAGGQALDLESVKNAGTWMRGLTDKPEDFVSASERFIKPQEGDNYVDPVMGFGWGNLPGAVAEQTGQLTGSLTSRAAGAGAGGLAGAPAGPGGAVTGAAIGAFAGPALFEFVQQIGPIALERARNNGREEPDWTDWSAAAGTAGAMGALNAIGIKGVGALNGTLKTVAANAAKEGLTEAGQSVLEQTGETAGTDKGFALDLKQAVGEGIIGAGSAGTVDATVNAPNAYRSVTDEIAIRRAMKQPFAAEDAEITSDLNDLANRETQDKGTVPQAKEFNQYRNDHQNKVLSALSKLGLSRDEFNDAKAAVKQPEGMTDERLDTATSNVEGLSDVAKKIQRMRQLTVQQQAAKGLKGYAAVALRSLGALGGGAVGYALGGPAGGAAGVAAGQGLGINLARKLSGSKTQGAHIEDLIGTKQARRARKLLERTGPSKASQSLSNIEGLAAEKVAEREAQKKAADDAKATLEAIKAWQKNRRAYEKQIEAAKTKEEKAKLTAEKREYDVASKALRLEMLRLQADQRAAMAQLAAEKVSGQRFKNELAVKKALEKAQKAQEKANKARTAAGYKGPRLKPEVYAAAKAKVEMTASGIRNPIAREETIKMLEGERRHIKAVIAGVQSRDPDVANLMRDLLTELENIKNNTADRKKAYEDTLEAVRVHAPEFVHEVRDAFERFATYEFKVQGEGKRQAKQEEDIPF